MPFSKEQEGKAANCFFEAAGSGNLASQQFHLPQQISLAIVVCRSEQNRTRSACDHRSRGSVARIRARQLGPESIRPQ